MIDITKYEILSDVGVKGKIGLESGAIRMFDPGDKSQWRIGVEKPGTYKLTIKVRTGDRNKNNNYIVPIGKYKIQVNGKDFTYSLGSIGQLETRYGQSYWGNLEGIVRFEAGENKITIESLGDWTGVESISFSPDVLDAPIDYQVLHLTEKTRADTLQVNFNSLQAKYDTLKAENALIKEFVSKIEVNETKIIEVIQAWKKIEPFLAV